MNKYIKYTLYSAFALMTLFVFAATCDLFTTNNRIEAKAATIESTIEKTTNINNEKQKKEIKTTYYTVKSVAAENKISTKTIEFEEEQEDYLYATISYKKGNKDIIYLIPYSKKEEAESQINNFGTDEEYFVPAEDIIIEEEIEVGRDTLPDPSTWTGQEWNEYQEYLNEMQFSEDNNEVAWMVLYYIDKGLISPNKVYQDDEGYYHYNEDYVEEIKTEIVTTVIKNTTTYKDFYFRTDMPSMYDKTKKYIVPSTSQSQLLEYLEKNFEKVESFEDIKKEDLKIYVKNNSGFVEIGLKDEYITRYKDLDLEKLDEALEFLETCEKNEDCKFRYIKVLDGVREEKIINVSYDSLMKLICLLGSNASDTNLENVYIETPEAIDPEISQEMEEEAKG